MAEGLTNVGGRENSVNSSKNKVKCNLSNIHDPQRLRMTLEELKELGV